MHPMQPTQTPDPRHEQLLPDSNQVGVVAAVVLLAYALTHLVNAPAITLAVQLPGFYFTYPLTFGTAMTLMAAGLTASGTDWLLHTHPGLAAKPTVEHWLLPTLMAFIIGALLDILPSGPAWWVGFAVSAAILVSILAAEYVAVDAGAPWYPVASAGLIALSYAAFLLLVIALRLGGARLFLVLPAVAGAAALVTLRTLHLRLSGKWEYPWAVAVGLTCVQLAAGFHYWPLTPLQFGLVLLAPLYALTALAISLGEDVPMRSALTEPALILAGLWTAAIFVR
jgi:hypothetical protein